MLTPLQQRKVWENMLAAEIRANYFADLSNRYRQHQRLATWFTLFLSSSALVTFIAKAGPWLPPALAFLTAALSAYSLVVQNQERAINGVDLHSRWNRLAKEYQALWDNMYDEGALNRLRGLEDTGSELSKAGAAFPYREKDMLRWQRHVEEHYHAVHAPS